MRLLATLLLTLAGVFLVQYQPVVYYVAAAICVVVTLLLLLASLRHPDVVSLRHAAIYSAAATLVAVITVILLATSPNGVSMLDPDTRQNMRLVILAAITAPSLYWGIALLTGGFDDD